MERTNVIYGIVSHDVRKLNSKAFLEENFSFSQTGGGVKSTSVYIQTETIKK